MPRQRRPTWGEAADGWPYHAFTFSASAAGVPTFTAPIETELDPGYDLPADGLFEIALGATATLIVAGTVADLVRHHLRQLAQ